MYDDQCQTHPLDDITFYFGGMTCGSCRIYPHLPERVMHPFGYLQVVPRDLFVLAPPTMGHKNVNVMYIDVYNHLLPEEAQSVPAL